LTFAFCEGPSDAWERTNLKARDSKLAN